MQCRSHILTGYSHVIINLSHLVGGHFDVYFAKQWSDETQPHAASDKFTLNEVKAITLTFDGLLYLNCFFFI